MRGTDRYSQYEADQYRNQGMRASKEAATYRDKFLALRKQVRLAIEVGDCLARPELVKAAGYKGDKTA